MKVRGSGCFREMTDAKPRSENVQDEPGASWVPESKFGFSAQKNCIMILIGVCQMKDTQWLTLESFEQRNKNMLWE